MEAYARLVVQYSKPLEPYLQPSSTEGSHGVRSLRYVRSATVLCLQVAAAQAVIRLIVINRLTVSLTARVSEHTHQELQLHLFHIFSWHDA